MLRIVTAEEGVTSVEYALIAAVVGIAAIVGLTQLGSARTATRVAVTSCGLGDWRHAFSENALRCASLRK